MPGGTLGFAAAAQLARIGPIAVPPLSVIVPPGHPGVRGHRIDLGPRDITRIEGLKVTDPAVTIVHLARTLAQVPFERAVQEAFAKRLTGAEQLERALERHRGGRGTARLRRMLELGVDDLRSEAERSLRHWIRRASLPIPKFNARLGPWRVDALWPEHELVVEVNGYAAHSSPWARRFTALQAIEEPALVIARIAAGLAARDA